MLPLLALFSPALAGSPVEDFDATVSAGLSHAEGIVVVRASDGTDVHTVARVAAERGCQHHHQWGHRPWHTLTCDPRVPARAHLAAFAQAPGLEWAQIPFEGELNATPNDLSASQWHHRNTGQRINGSTGVVGADIGSIDAWDITVGDDVIVAVIDTGARVDHVEIVDAIHAPPGEVCDNGVDDDSNGYIDDCWGWDVGDDDNDPDPRDLPTGGGCIPNHGQFIAGLIGATGNNGTGAVGVQWNAHLMPIKMSQDEDCKILDTSLAEGVYYAVDNGAKVINTSWSIGASTRAMQDAFNTADSAGVLVAISAGNNSTDLDGVTTYPVDYHLGTDLVVAATTNRDTRASFSNWGSADVDLGAPGSFLYSTNIDSTTSHGVGSGTSFASPLVAGVAALVWSEYPMLRGDEVKASILDGAEPIDALDCARTAQCVASGARLDAPGALAQAELWATSPQLELVDLTISDLDAGDADGRLERGETGELRVAVLNDGHAVADDVVATVAVTHPHASLDATTIDIGRIEPYATVRPAGSVALSIDLACEADQNATLAITLRDRTTGEVWAASDVIFVRCDIDDDSDGVRYPEDCDDGDARVFPGADERCNGADDDCDEAIDEDAVDATDWYVDADDDGFGVDGAPIRACDAPDGYTGRAGDCDDTRGDVNPDADEVCDGADNDCDTHVDDRAIDAPSWYIDGDGDGYGSDVEVIACEQPAGATDNPDDCDDGNPEAWPGSETHRTDCTERLFILGCACSSSGPPSAGWLAGLPLLLALRRRRRG